MNEKQFKKLKKLGAVIEEVEQGHPGGYKLWEGFNYQIVYDDDPKIKEKLNKANRAFPVKRIDKKDTTYTISFKNEVKPKDLKFLGKISFMGLIEMQKEYNLQIFRYEIILE